MKSFLFFLGVCLSQVMVAQSSHSLGVFPTIDHSGKLSKKLDYGLYYFAASPFFGIRPQSGINENKLLLLYGENGLTFHVSKKLGLTAAYVFQKENPMENVSVNENRIH